MVSGAAGFFLFYLRSGGHVGFVDKCWRVSVRSLLVWAYRAGVRHAHFCFLCSSLGGTWAQEAAARRIVMCGDVVF